MLSRFLRQVDAQGGVGLSLVRNNLAISISSRHLIIVGPNKQNKLTKCANELDPAAESPDAEITMLQNPRKRCKRTPPDNLKARTKENDAVGSFRRSHSRTPSNLP
ncbi:hypothetical protein PoB_007292700 [Plakobranchus ocellatus]|uniref:Uncharacterized protein n=1 Tax=Plakobranchus ocellatus TaxID=259542 RepID=A0AAV4DQ90_9GAST|nr:hypothetical protein PoB_007292700 [Plakobranchus ocellatus]